MAFDAFLKLDGIQGESQDLKHKGEIDILSFSWGVTQPASQRGGHVSGRADVQDFSVVKHIDKSSPLLFAAACHGDHIKQAVFTLRKAGENPLDFYKVTMSDVLISSVRPGGSAGGEGTSPLEEVSLNFGQLSISFTPQDATGKPGNPVTTTCDSHR